MSRRPVAIGNDTPFEQPMMKKQLASGSLHDASASFQGYIYQARYALLRSLQEGRLHPSHAVSIEKFDDVAFEQDGRPVELIQTKHHNTSGDVSDRSVDLWRTLNIWIERIAEEPLDSSDTRLLFLTTNTAQDDSALSLLREGNGNRDESRALETLTLAAQTSRNQVTAPYRRAFLNLSNIQKEILVRNIWVFDNAPNILNVREDIESVLHYSAPPDKVGTLTDQLEGWWFARVILALSDTGPSVVPLLALENKVSELREMYRIGNLLLAEAVETMSPELALPPDNRTFIRQMSLINITEAEVRATAHDYYRAYEQRSRWASQNLLLDGESDRYDRGLHDAWYRRFLASTVDFSDECEEDAKIRAGRKVFRWAREYQKPFRNREETWLSAGSLQMLSDAQRVGWHPNYELRLPRKDEVKCP